MAIGLLPLVMPIWGSALVVARSIETDLPSFAMASGLLVPIAGARGSLSILPRPRPWIALTAMGLTGGPVVERMI